jgi:CspA family cold shock protein
VILSQRAGVVKPQTCSGGERGCWEVSGDLLIQCAECGASFVWTLAEQAAGPRPDLCPMCRRLAPAPGRSRGVVKWYSRAKGYGFITPTQGPDLFVHKSALDPDQPPLRAGQLVEFARTTAERGMQAERVTVLNAAE